MKPIHLLCFGLSVCFAAGIAWGQYDGGTGTALDPYQIRTAAQMNSIGLHPEDWDDHFILTDDIDLSAYTAAQYNIIGTSFSSSGAFTGVFDGKDHVIRNLTYTSSDAPGAVGLFGYTSGATFRNVKVENVLVDIVYTYPFAGASIGCGVLAGRLRNGTVENCIASGSIKTVSENGYVYVGGLVGGIDFGGTLSGCHSSVSIDASLFDTQSCYAGGLAGYIEGGGTISDCHSSGQVTAFSNRYSYAAGLVGYIREAVVITDCTTGGSIDASVDSEWECYAGGLVGYMENGSISSARSTGPVTAFSSDGESYAGGLAGTLWSVDSVSDCHASGVVDANGFDVCAAGGLVGYLYASPTADCSGTGAVTAISRDDDCYAGGLIGHQYHGSLTRCLALGAIEAAAAENCYAGGLAGRQYDGSISDCYGRGAVTAHSPSVTWNSCAGGLVGNQYNGDAPIHRSYSTGPVSATGVNVYEGGLVGRQQFSTVADSFWDTQTSGQPTSAGGTGKTTAEMKMQATYTGAGWDFVTVWTMRCEHMNYPRLAWETLLAGDLVCPDGVGMEDLSVVSLNWLTGNVGADLDSSGTVSLTDIVIMAGNWLSGRW